MSVRVGPMGSLRWFCVYRSHVFVEKGVRTERTFGGKSARCYHDLEVVRYVARKWLPARPDAQAFIYEAFPLKDEPPLERYSGQQSWVSDEPNTAARPLARTWRWTKFGRRTRLVLLEMLVQPEHRVVQLTEEFIVRGYHVGEPSMSTKRSARDPFA